MIYPKRIMCLVSAASVLLCTGCASDEVVRSHREQVEITLAWWGNDARHEYTIKGIEAFEELHPDIKVNLSYSEWSGYEARNRVRMIAGSETDVMQINVGWIKAFSPDGKGYYDIEELDSYVDLSSFTEDKLNYGRVNGILNAVPIAMNAETVYINKTIYEKYGLSVPQTWDDYFNAAKVMSKDGVYPLSGAGKTVWLLAIAYTEQKCGKTILDENGKLNFSKNDLRTMISFYKELVDKKVIPQVEFYDRLNINSGDYAGTIAWVSDAKNYCGTAIDNGFEVVPAPYPAFSADKSGDGWYAKPATLYAISKNTEHPREAGLLLDFLLNSNEMALLQGIEKGIPLSEKALGALDEAGMLSGLQYDASLVMDNNTRISQMDPALENTSVIEKYIDFCNLVIYDKSTLDETAEALYADLQKDL